MRDNPSCLECGKPFPDDARVDRMYCDRLCNNRRYKKIRSGRVVPLPALDPVERLGQMTPQQLGWVAGIVEGEGSITLHRGRRYSGNTYTYAIVSVSMTDEDVIRRLQSWTGVGRVSGPHLPPVRAQAGHQPQWAWRVTKADAVFALVDLLLPLLGQRRQEQAAKMRKAMDERTLIRGRGFHN